MLIQDLSSFFERDLLKVAEELLAYRDEKKIWAIEANISNSAGNLCLHLVGNLQHFIGATLGSTGYVRKRELEFSDKNVPRSLLLEKIHDTIAVVKQTLAAHKDEDLAKNFPLLKHDKVVTTQHMLLHLLAHLSYHLGQINYHRRLIDQ